MKQKISKRVKQIFTGILILLFVSQPALFAYASGRNITPQLHKLSFLSDTMMYVEYESSKRSWNLRLSEGDYAVIAPIHSVNTNYLSYDLQSAKSSDSSIVSVSYQKEENGKLGLKLRAHKAGNAEISVTFRTYTTRMGLNYEDMRGDSTVTKKVYVEVEPEGSVDVKLNISGGKYSSVKGVTLSMVTMKDTFSNEKKREIQEYVAEATEDYRRKATGMESFSSMLEEKTGIDVELAASDPEAAVEKLNQENMKSTLSDMQDVLEKQATAMGDTVSSAIIKGGKTVTGVVGNTMDFFDNALTVAERINRAYVYAKYASMKVPVFAPQELTLSVSVTNNTPNRIDNVMVNLEKDSHLSFSSVTGPWGGSQCMISGISIEPGETKTVSTKIYPRFVYGTLSTAGEKVKAYTAEVEANVSYMKDSKIKYASEKVSLDAYTTITQEKLDAYKRTLLQEQNAENVNAFTSALLGGAFNGYKRWYGYSSFGQVFIFACPVEISIRNKNGEELTVLSQDGEVYAGENITGFVSDDVKYVIVSEEAQDEYQISARATDAGNMDVITYKYGEETGVSIKAYEAVPLETGASFAVQNCADAAADLGSADDSGVVTTLSADYRLDQEMMIAELMGLGLTEEEADACVKLMVRGVITEDMIENLSDEMDQEGFCELLLNAADNYFGISLTTEEADGASAVQRAQSAGLLSAEQEAVAGFTLEDALALTDRLLEKMGVDTETIIYTEWAEKRGIQLVEAEAGEGEEETDPVSGLTAGYYLDQGLAENGTLPVKSALLLAERILEYAETAQQRDSLIVRMCDAYTNSMSWADFYSMGMYATDQDAAHELLLENFVFWMPETGFSDMILSNLVDIVDLEIYLYDLVHADNGESTVEEQGYEILFCPEFAGVFADENGSTYRWIPFCYLDEQGEIYQDAVYLFIMEVREGIAKDYVERNGLSWNGENATVDFFVVADQEITATFLETALPTVMQASLYAEKSRLFYTWVQDHADDTVYERAMQKLTQRESAPVYHLPANTAADDLK